MNFKSRPEGRLNCRARIGSSAWLRGSSQNSKFETVHYSLSDNSDMDIELDSAKEGIYVFLIFHAYAGLNMYALQTYYSQTSTKIINIINNYSEYHVTSKGLYTINVSQSRVGGLSDIYLYRLV